MKRRDFVRGTAITALSSTLLTPFAALAEGSPTHIESEDLNTRAALKDDYSLHFLALGDWGRVGADHQLQVARQMGKWANEHPNDFIVSTGDNFYPSGVASEHDPLWASSFENIYTDYPLQWDWYPVLGNHDYHSDPDAQVRYSAISRRWRMPARYYAKTKRLSNDAKVLFVFIDTNQLIAEFHENPDYGPKVAGYDAQEQLSWIKKTLANAEADVKWKIVVGHHPYYTVGPRIKNYDTLAVRKHLADVFAKYKVDVYLSGHDHSLQHIKPEGVTHQFISGAGSEITPVTPNVAYCKFAESDYGFMYFSMRADQFNAKVISHEGTILYETNISKPI
jgi:tartrate-resistant acid phosphatase type 5